MTFSLTHYDRVAKLLARENLIVVHDENLAQSEFDSQERVLKLPLWDTDESTYYFMVSRAVGRALHTTPKMLQEVNTKLRESIFGVIEDYRCDGRMIGRYPGLQKDYTNYWTDQLDTYEPFPVDHPDFNFLDRLFYYLKLSANCSDKAKRVSFREKEVDLVKRSLKAQTEEEIIQLMKDIEEYMKEEGMDNQSDDQSSDQSGDSSESGDQSSGDSTDGDGNNSESGEGDPEDSDENESNEDGGNKDDQNKSDGNSSDSGSSKPTSSPQLQENFEQRMMQQKTAPKGKHEMNFVDSDRDIRRTSIEDYAVLDINDFFSLENIRQFNRHMGE